MVRTADVAHAEFERRSRRPLAFGFAAVMIVALAGWLVMRPSGEERVARRDVVALSDAIAEYVGARAELPSVAVTTRTLESGDEVWGAYYQVGDRRIPRSDPDTGRPFFVVGTADQWCVEVQFVPAGFFADSVPPEWVAAHGSGGDVRRWTRNRCGDDYAMAMAPVTTVNVPEPGSLVAAAHARVGTCLTEILPYGPPNPLLEVADCREAHFAEIYHTGSADGGDYGEYQESAARECAETFRPFIGVPHNVSVFTGEPFTVDDTAWTAGDRRFSCVVFLGSEDYPLVGSARDSRR
jgi:hypothetical protein